MGWRRLVVLICFAGAVYAQPPRLTRNQSSVNGNLRRLSTTQLVIQTEDHRVVWYRLADKLKFLKEGNVADPATFGIGDFLEVVSNTDQEGNLTATDVRWLRKATEEERVAANATRDLPPMEGEPLVLPTGIEPAAAAADQPAPQQEAEGPIRTGPATIEKPPPTPRDEDDPGRPVLRRGKPAPEVAEAKPPEPVPTPAAHGVEPVKIPVTPPPPRTGGDDELLAKARAAALAFTDTLPNYLSQQLITRYQTRNIKRGWDPIDTVSVDVTYENGRESYRNVKIDGKPIEKPFEEIDGAQSTGEFGSLMAGIFLPGTAATFRHGPNRTIAGRSAVVYDFTVARENSHWHIQVPSQIYFPSYAGSIWVDKDTGRVLRIEQHATNLPDEFPYDTAETAVDYGFVTLGDADQYLVPVDSEVLTCVRGANLCMKNHTEFRRYRKFGAETNIVVGQPQ